MARRKSLDIGKPELEGDMYLAAIEAVLFTPADAGPRYLLATARNAMGSVDGSLMPVPKTVRRRAMEVHRLTRQHEVDGGPAIPLRDAVAAVGHIDIRTAIAAAPAAVELRETLPDVEEDEGLGQSPPPPDHLDALPAQQRLAVCLRLGLPVDDFEPPDHPGERSFADVGRLMGRSKSSAEYLFKAALATLRATGRGDL